MPLCQHAAHYLLHNIPTKAEIQKYRGRNTEIQRRIYGACYLLHKTEIQKYRNREGEDMWQYAACYLLHNIPTKAELLLEPLSYQTKIRS